MKKLIIALIITMLYCTTAMAANVTLAWDPNTEEDLVGYKIYQSTESGVYDKGNPIGVVACDPLDEPCCRYTVQDLPDGTFFFVVTAYDSDANESGFSNEVSKRIDTTPPANPGNLLIEAIDLAIKSLEKFREYISIRD